MDLRYFATAGPAFKRLTSVLLLTGLLGGVSPIAFPAMATASWLQGVVTNGATGQPIVGARITVNGIKTWSTGGGVYGMAVDPPGSYPVYCLKSGYENYTSAPVNFTGGGTIVQNITLWENLNSPVAVTAFLDTSTMRVPVNWQAPSGDYEILYDDGIQDNFTVWAAQGNMNAMRFTPAGYPAKVTGGSVHIGTGSNYPPACNPLVTFQVRIYDATGPGGSPGNSLAGPFDVTPTALGWVEFSFPAPVTVASGSFYLAMIQGGTAPNAAGIAIDETAPQWRSWSRFVTGGSAWYPAGGNFMIRAKCNGSGGPAWLGDDPLAGISTTVYRLKQGEEQNVSAWTSLGSTVATSAVDSNWSALPCGPYRWGVKTLYSGNRWSPMAFSNVLGKCWTAPVTVLVALSCDTLPKSGTSIRLVNLAYPDTVYQGLSDTVGKVVFPSVWKGNYRLIASRFNFDSIQASVPVAGPVTQSLLLFQVKMPPANLEVNDSSLIARWDVPRFDEPVFAENWSSGSFATNGWTVEGGSNWIISSALGYPAPSATFSPIPQQIGYSQTLTSRPIAGLHSTQMKLDYDIFLDSYGNTTINTMAAEIWDGSVWHILKTYSSSGGDIPWTREEIDLSAYSSQNFRIRFRAFGGDTYDISNWSIDNIGITATEPAQLQANCILGYYFYLGSAISGYTTKTAYPIPGNQVQYGQTYTACVRALYGSGYSDFSCTTFTSHYLYPVRELTGSPIENTAFLSWQKPSESDTASGPPPGLIGYKITRNDSVIATLNNPDTLVFYDPGLEPGYYRYGVSAIYDLAAYGFPGQTGESLPSGPLHIAITWGRQLPFFEAWNSGTFSFNEWRFMPSQGNWTLDPNEGLPAPAANFRWQPPAVNYDFSLESPSFNGLPFNCAALWLDFDLKLNDRNQTGTEKMTLEVFYNNSWHKKAEFRNTGSFDWTNYHLDISPARGKGFRIRFRASGLNSSELLNWFIDNVSVYPVCYPATDLSATVSGTSATLTWNPPACYGGNILNEGFEEDGFPPPQWSKLTANPSAGWSHLTSGSTQGVHHGNYSAGLDWDYNHQDEWLIAHNVYVNGDLTFWSYAFQGSLHQDHYYIKVSADQGANWDVLMDMSALSPYPGPGGINAWETPYHVDLSMYDGETIDIAWQAVDGDGNGLWYPWAIDDCSIGEDDHGRVVTGYDVYRRDGITGAFQQVNGSTLTDTTWTDTGLVTGSYYYYVQVRFDECSASTPSDTVPADVITSAGHGGKPVFSVFPNPASGRIIVSGSNRMQAIMLITPVGQTVARWEPGDRSRFDIDVGRFPRGMYLLRIQGREDEVTVKICLKSD